MKKTRTAIAAALLATVMATTAVAPASAAYEKKYNSRWICNYFPVFCNG